MTTKLRISANVDGKRRIIIEDSCHDYNHAWEDIEDIEDTVWFGGEMRER